LRHLVAELELPSLLVCASVKLASPGFFTNRSTLETPELGDASVACASTAIVPVLSSGALVAPEIGLTLSSSVVLSALALLASSLPAVSWASGRSCSHVDGLAVFIRGNRCS